jgi:hypothetical protein
VTAEVDLRTYLRWVLVAVEWIDGDLADGVDAVLSCINTLGGVDQTLLTLTNANNDDWYYPRTAEHDQTGAPLTTTTPLIVNGDLQLAVTNGGDTKSGAAVIYLMEA